MMSTRPSVWTQGLRPPSSASSDGTAKARPTTPKKSAPRRLSAAGRALLSAVTTNIVAAARLARPAAASTPA
jgi:hypothetical protein